MSAFNSDNDPSVTRWLTDLKDGDQQAAARLWDFLRIRLTKISKAAVVGPSTAYDEDDVAQSAFISLCSAIQAGRYEMLADRDELWKLLAVITVNKAKNRAVSERRLRRGGGANRVSEEELRRVAAPDLPAEEQLMMSEECDRLMALLPRVELQDIALLKVEGHTNESVAQQMGCSRRSVQRRLNLIREIWTRQLP